MLALYSISTVALTAAASYRWRSAVSLVSNERFIIPVTPPIRTEARDSILGVLETMIATTDPFRLANAPSSVAYDPSTDGMPSAGAPSFQPLRPTFALKAIVGGPPWQAIVDGIPGQPSSTIVLDGMTFGTLAIRAVTRDSVVIQGPDTTWVLSFRKSS